MERSSYDVIVVGSGLSGLVAGLHLQGKGRRVLILEKRKIPGGLCGSFVIDGYEFVTACNDFGLGIKKEMQRLGVPAAFKKARTRFHFDQGVLEIPLRPRTLLALLPQARDLLRFARAVRSTPEGTLGPLVEEHVRSARTADAIHSLAYPLGVAPDDLSLEVLRSGFSRDDEYGYHQPTVPVGGPGTLVDQMLQRFEALGGTIAFERECLAIRSQETCKAVLTDRGTYLAECVITSRDRRVRGTKTPKSGLALSMFLVAVRKELPFPEGIHTIVHLPAGISRWMAELDTGIYPGAFGFHLFCSNLPTKPDCYTLNICFYLPRDVEDPAVLARAEAYVFRNAEGMLPGLGAAILYKRFLSPAQFTELHGLSSRPTPWVMKPGFHRSEAPDSELGVYPVGDAMSPRPQHAGAAICSGVVAAEEAIREMASGSHSRCGSSGSVSGSRGGARAEALASREGIVTHPGW